MFCFSSGLCKYSSKVSLVFNSALFTHIFGHAILFLTNPFFVSSSEVSKGAVSFVALMKDCLYLRL